MEFKKQTHSSFSLNFWSSLLKKKKKMFKSCKKHSHGCCHFVSCSLRLWHHDQNGHVWHRCLLHQEPSFFGLYLYRTDGTNLTAPWEAQIFASRKCFCCININRPTTQSHPVETSWHFLHFHANLYLHVGSPTNHCLQFAFKSSLVQSLNHSFTLFL